jgi:ubiquinone/menaquinone biosynthesis C-methylase UbiE
VKGAAPLTQNIYDNQKFFEKYQRLPRSLKGLSGAPEWPVLRAMLPAVGGLRVLDLGCGFGWFSRWARQRGASRVLGIDVSQKMLERARTETHDPQIRYLRADLERLRLQSSSFDLVFSSLALHYVKNLDRLMSKVHRSLVPGGSLVFSVEHPIYTAPSSPRWRTAAGHKFWPVDGYLEEGPRSTDWLARGVIKHHRTLASYLNMLLRLGFSISEVNEWGPTRGQIALQPGWADERERPAFLLVAARR